MSCPVRPSTRGERWLLAVVPLAMIGFLALFWAGLRPPLIVFSRVLRLALVAWLGISAAAWAVIFGITGPFKSFRKQPSSVKENARPGDNSLATIIHRWYTQLKSWK
jgi:hypothetical protein